ncbi:MAG: hypothetical protein QM497_00930 [Sulfurimonas sp.]
MVTTKHCQARMSQRGLPKRLLDLVLEFGKDEGNKLVLNKKITQAIIDELDAKKKQLLKIMDKGGVTIVVQDDICITTYNTNK